MKEILFINACVRAGSRTESLCSNYINKCFQKENYFVKEIKLKELNLEPLYEKDLEIRNSDIESNDFSKPEYKLAKDFSAADLIIIAAPYWDCSFPSMLKVYFEHICVNNISFRMMMTESLLKNAMQKNLYMYALQEDI